MGEFDPAGFKKVPPLSHSMCMCLYVSPASSGGVKVSVVREREEGVPLMLRRSAVLIFPSLLADDEDEDVSPDVQLENSH